MEALVWLVAGVCALALMGGIADVAVPRLKAWKVRRAKVIEMRDWIAEGRGTSRW